VTHADPEKIAWARELQERYPADSGAEHGLAGVIRTGVPELIPEVTEEMLVGAARNAEHLAILRRVGITSAIIAPILARERTLGAISFVAAESGHRYDERDLRLAQDLTRRAALAIENAHLYDAERDARVLAEEAQAWFRALFEATPDAILVVGGEDRVVDANRAACDLLGYALGELLNLHFGDLAADGDAASVRFARRERDDEDRIEREVQRRDGSRIPVEIWSRRLNLPTGPIGIGVLRNMSERRHMDQIREEVLSAISHDLRSPLGAIKLHAQSLQRLVRRGGDIDRGRLDDGLAAIDKMSTRVASLLEDVVEVARERDSQGVPYVPEPTDLVALAQRCAAEADAAAAREVRVDSSVAALVGMWDAQGIERVVLNVLNNAVKYSPAGGEVIVRVGETDAADRHWAVIEVQDQGIGIPAADLPRIFERFWRGRNVGAIGGTGLGLTGAWQIVERHAGAIDVASEEGRGTTVTVRLPLDLETTSEAASVAP
jgi:PAS domain S-box-containing protein